MKTALTFTHPTFEQFLLFHLGPYAFTDEYQEELWTANRVVDALRQKGFPFDHTRIGANVHLMNESLGKKAPTLLCAKGESTAPAIAFLAGKTLTDRENNWERAYGPVVIASTHYHDDFVTYYDAAVRDVFKSSIIRTLFADPATLKTSWYGRVNGYAIRKYLEDILDQLVQLHGLSTLVSHLNSQNGAMVLTDSARSASLAITLIGLLSPNVPDQIVYTVGFACFVQHFGVLFKEIDHYPGKIYDPSDEETVKALAFLGVSEFRGDTLSHLGIDCDQVLRILRYDSNAAPGIGNAPTSLYPYFSLANHLAALYFTRERRVYNDGVYTVEENPCFGNCLDTMKELDKIFATTKFYPHHRDKIYYFLENAKRYFKSNVWSRVSQGAYVSAFQRQQAAS